MTRGAAVTYRLPRFAPGRRIRRWLYAHVPGFAPVAQRGYTFFARRRGLLNRLTTLPWGSTLEPPRYDLVRGLFLRGLGLASFLLPTLFRPAVLAAATAATLIVEVVLVFLLFAPQRLRAFAAWCVIEFQRVTAPPGNYGFFDLLTILPGLFVLDDAALPALVPKRWQRVSVRAAHMPAVAGPEDGRQWRAPTARSQRALPTA